MVKPLPFAAAVLALLALCAALVAPDPGSDWFAELPAGQSLAIDRLAVDELAALKLHHLENSPPMDVLLLGNSRPLPVSSDDLAVPAGHFFNLALTGESLRSSVAALEYLRARGKLPKMALISFDHCEIQYYSNPLWPRLGQRWSMAARDLAAGLSRPSIAWAELARMARRHLVSESEIFLRALAFDRVARGVRLRWLRLTGGDAREVFLSTSGYRGDGSRPHPATFEPFTSATPLPPPNRNVLPGYLDYDLERLEAISAAGTRVVIFETVLAPSLHPAAMKTPSPPAAEIRTALASLCARHRLECRMAPASYDARNLPWQDSGHPPAAVMADLIRPFAPAKAASHDLQ